MKLHCCKYDKIIEWKEGFSSDEDGNEYPVYFCDLCPDRRCVEDKGLIDLLDNPGETMQKAYRFSQAAAAMVATAYHSAAPQK